MGQRVIASLLMIVVVPCTAVANVSGDILINSAYRMERSALRHDVVLFER